MTGSSSSQEGCSGMYTQPVHSTPDSYWARTEGRTRQLRRAGFPRGGVCPEPMLHHLAGGSWGELCCQQHQNQAPFRPRVPVQPVVKEALIWLSSLPASLYFPGYSCTKNGWLAFHLNNCLGQDECWYAAYQCCLYEILAMIGILVFKVKNST